MEETKEQNQGKTKNRAYKPLNVILGLNQNKFFKILF